MTEQEWLECKDPQKILEFLKGRASDRKLRLFLTAWGHRTLVDSPYEDLTDVVPAVELFVEKAISPADFAPAREEIGWGTSEMCESLNLRAEVLSVAVQEEPVSAEAASQAAARALEGWRMNVPDLDIHKENLALCNLLRDIFGNPLRPIAISPSILAWRDSTIPRLALAVYDKRQLPGGHLDPALLAVLADALEEAGCRDADILGHLRSPGPHVRGCWPVDLLLGRK